jgi:hypothetical protein
MIVNLNHYPPNWKKVSRIIRKLAGGHCQRCGCESNRLSVHHIGVPYANGQPGDPRDKYDVRLENLITLCHECHGEVDDGQKRYIKMMTKRRSKLEQHRLLGVGSGLVLLCTQAIIVVKVGGQQ